MIQLKSVDKVYRTDRIETYALSDVNLEVAKGEFISIMGPSGCGKSTMLNLMGLLDAPSKGQVVLDANPVSNYADKEVSDLRNRTLGFVFQNFHLINDLRVRDNVELPLLYRKNCKAKDRTKKAEEALERVGLSSRIHHFPSQLSGGQRQRVAIARAIIGKPQVLLADEPTGNLDSHMGNEIMEILKQLNREGTTIVMVTHDQRLAEETHRIVRIFDGKMVA